jgi:quercetin dioxygenase-like cupin family protein
MNNAIVNLGSGEGDKVWFLDNFLVVKSRGPNGVVEATLPAGSETPFHRHDDGDEAFYVLEGKIEIFFDGGRTVVAEPGSYVHIPRGTPHGFRTKTPLRMLVIGDFVDFACDAGARAPAPPDMDRLGVAAQKHHIAILGPLPVNAPA